MAAYAYESITVSSAAIGFTAAKIALAESLYGRDVDHVVCTVETNPLRYTVDGTTPTSTVGHLMADKDVFVIDKDDVPKFKAIRTGSDATLKCTFYV